MLIRIMLLLLLALSWYRCSGGQGGTTQVVLPYKDSLMLFAKYLQQLIMESLGKEFDLEGKEVHQGLAVMGNKGTSDQHSYVQQLVGGPSNIFVTCVQVLKDRAGASMEVGEGSCSEKAGLLVGDIIVEAGGKTIASMSDLLDARRFWHAGDTVTIVALREGERLTFSVTLDEDLPQ